MKPIIHLIPIIKFINSADIVVIDPVFIFAIPPDLPCAFAIPGFAVKQDLFAVFRSPFIPFKPCHLKISLIEVIFDYSLTKRIDFRIPEGFTSRSVKDEFKPTDSRK